MINKIEKVTPNKKNIPFKRSPAYPRFAKPETFSCMRWETQFCPNFQKYFANEGDFAYILFSKPLRFVTFEQASWKKIKSHLRFWEQPKLSLYCKLQMVNLEAGHVASNAPKSGVHHHIVWLRHPRAPSKEILYSQKEVFLSLNKDIMSKNLEPWKRYILGQKKAWLLLLPQIKISLSLKWRFTDGQK